ncbi:MAG: hypothetical protein SGJ21_11375 [Alphaproteobacteria bacterium]|nr:hypothetical protein [Alphaproteobacteria bacterium]
MWSGLPGSHAGLDAELADHFVEMPGARAVGDDWYQSFAFRTPPRITFTMLSTISSRPEGAVYHNLVYRTMLPFETT